MSASRGFALLKRCRALLREISPEEPPATAKHREFEWQCRALRERVHLYSCKLADVAERGSWGDPELLKIELAIERSLRYFHNVLSPRFEDDGA